MLERSPISTERAMWRWVTWAISWAITEASSLSDSEAMMSPVLRPTQPPGAAKALIAASLTTKKLKARSWEFAEDTSL